MFGIMFAPKHNILASVAFLLVIFICCKQDDIVEKCCQCLEQQNIFNPYDFPIKPGDEEWKNLQSHKAMVDACQIPQDFLESMCTHDLVETYFKYPLLFVVTAFINIKDGFDQMRMEFNGFEELTERYDAALKIVKKYENMDAGELDTTWTLLEQGHFVTSFWYIEFTLGYDPILEQLSDNEKNALLNIALSTYESKKEHNHSDPSLITTIFLISNILYDLNYGPFIEFLDQRPELRSFVNGYLNGLAHVSDGNMIVDYAKNFLIQ